MGFWIFDRKKNAETSARMLDAALAERERMARTAVRVKHTVNSGRSRIGGAPLLPAEFQWPQWKGRSLSHVAQLDLEELWAAVPDGPDWLPRAGLLTFFYDQEQSTWGFDPADKDSWRVCIVESTNLRETALPDDMEKHARYVPVTVGFEIVPSFPSWERLVRPEDLRCLTPADDEKWAKLALSEEAPNHRIGG